MRLRRCISSRGVGMLRVDRAYDILLTGKQSVGAAIRPAAGWDYARVCTSNEAVDQFHLVNPAAEFVRDPGWNRTITGLRTGRYDSTPNLANFALSPLQLRAADIDQQYENERVGVLLETTGLADPAPILSTLLTDPMLEAQFRVDGLVTTVDAVNGIAQLRDQPEAAKQAAVADRLLITKSDLVEPEQLAELGRRLARVIPARARSRSGTGASR